DREAGRHRQADAAHLGQPGAFAAEQRFHLTVAVRFPAAEPIHMLAGGLGLGSGGWTAVGGWLLVAGRSIAGSFRLLGHSLLSRLEVKIRQRYVRSVRLQADRSGRLLGRRNDL